MSNKFPVTQTLRWAEYKGNALLGLNSSELIIRVALFEACLKEIHRQVLLARPQLLSFCKPNRAIPLKEIFRGGFEQFIVKETDRQVREGDRLKTREKAKSFERRLRLPWGKDVDIPRIEYLIELRHTVVHGDHTTSVTDKDIEDARATLLQIVTNCAAGGAKAYPSHFAAP